MTGILSDEKKTPLYEMHLEAGGKMVPFAGYILPVQYSGIIAEHMAARTKAAIFDVSHMAEVVYSGKDAFANLQKILTNDLTGMTDGRVRYSVMCYEDGGAVDDMIVYKYDDEKYLAVINAANREKDVAWMQSHKFGDVSVDDISDGIAQIAIQGPKSREILEKLTDPLNIPEKYYTFKDGVEVAGVKCLLSQTGYTGELGFELYFASEDATRLWRALLEAGKEEGLIPAGLGARDTLRFEAGMPLYGHEMGADITPLEAGASFAVKLDKGDFIGKEAMTAKGTPRKVVGLQITGRGIAREHETVYIGEQAVGHTTSGTHCPYLGAAYAMALLDEKYAGIDTEVEIDVRGRRVGAKIVPLPFYKRTK